MAAVPSRRTLRFGKASTWDSIRGYEGLPEIFRGALDHGWTWLEPVGRHSETNEEGHSPGERRCSGWFILAARLTDCDLHMEGKKQDYDTDWTGRARKGANLPA